MPSVATQLSHTSPRHSLNYATYLDAVHGLWIGKFIGGTLGAPIEGIKEQHNFKEDLVPAGIAENDDTDLQLLWLHALEEYGPLLTADELVREWREHVRAPWNEYGIAAANWERGVSPPESGRGNNWFWGECMGCPIRSEIWGVICPGAPALAARYASMDGSIDHFGDAVEAEKFFAAIEAGIFFEKDLERLLACGLQQIDPASRLTRLVGDVLKWSREFSWQESRRRLLAAYGHADMTHALQNVGFTLIGLLAGRHDFGRTLAITLNCGYDADCSAATAGAILGGILGYEGIPTRFREAVPATYRVSDWMRGFPREGSIRELSLACAHFGNDVAKAWQTGIQISGMPSERVPPLDVTRVPLVEPTSARNPFPCWVVTGPYWRAWEEKKMSAPDSGEHGMPGLPSVQYFTHNHSGFDRNWLSPAQLAFDVLASNPDDLLYWMRPACSDVLPLDDIASGQSPACYYAAAEFDVANAAPRWMMVGATGPIECWLNGAQVLHSETYQPLTPTTFPLKVNVSAGRNRVMLKLARTSQPLGAYLAFKRDTGAHWHQSFYETSFEWVRPSGFVALD